MKYSRGTQAEKARRDGVHPSTVSRRVRDGRDDLSGLDNERRMEKVVKDTQPKQDDRE